MNNRKIVFFHPGAELYGADKILLYLLQYTPSFRKILVVPGTGPLLDIIASRFPDITVIIDPHVPVIARKYLSVSGLWMFLFNCFKFRRSINHLLEREDIVYVNTLAVLPILYFTQRSYRKILHVHEILNNNKRLNRIINRFALRHADNIICVSKAVFSNFLQLNTPFNHKLKLVQNGISIEDNGIEKHISDTPAIKQSYIHFALIGRLKPENKGQLFLINAIEKIPQTLLVKCRFSLIGSTVKGQEYMYDEIDKAIQAAKLQNIVKIYPFTKDIATVYRDIDVAIVPSLFDDPFPTTVLEAMAYGKPVIGTYSGGIPEMIQHNQNGFLVNRQDATQLAKYILFYVEHPEQIEIMGNIGQALYHKHFTEKQFANRYKKILSEIL